MGDVADLLNKESNGLSKEQIHRLIEAHELVRKGILAQEVYEKLVDEVVSSANASDKDTKAKREGLRAKLFSLLSQEKKAEDEARERVILRAMKSKPVIEGYLLKRGKKGMNGKYRWKKRYVTVHPEVLLIYRKKEDEKPIGAILLTADFFVSDLGGKKRIAKKENDDDDDDDDDDVAEEEENNVETDGHQHVFNLSDTVQQHYFAAADAELKTYWLHVLAIVLRKIIEAANTYDRPQFIGQTTPSPEEIQREFENRQEAYRQTQRKATMKRAKRRSRFTSKARRKEMEEEMVKNEEKWDEEGAEVAAKEVGALLVEQERQRAKELEEAQRKKEQELEETRRLVEEWKSKAEENERRYQEEKQKVEREHNAALEADRRLNEIMEEMKRQAAERETAIKDERDAVQSRLQNMASAKERGHMSFDEEGYKREIAALEAKLAALQSALDVNFDGLDWDGTLEDAEAKMKLLVPALMNDDPAVVADAQAEFDQWDKIIRNHADYKKREQEKWETWEQVNAPKNKEALAEMKKLVPKEILGNLSEDDLVKRGVLKSAARRILKTKIFHFFYISTEDIAKVHIADLSSRYVPQGLDIVELRAVYACLPSEFQNDRDGRKQQWLDNIRAKLFDLTKREEEGTLTGPEKRHPAYKSLPTPSPSAPGAGKGNAKKSKKNKPKVAKKVDTSGLEALFGDRAAGKGPPKLPGAGKGDNGEDEGSDGPPLAGIFAGPSKMVLESRRKAMEAAEAADRAMANNNKPDPVNTDTKTDVTVPPTETDVSSPKNDAGPSKSARSNVDAAKPEKGDKKRNAPTQKPKRESQTGVRGFFSALGALVGVTSKEEEQEELETVDEENAEELEEEEDEDDGKPMLSSGTRELMDKAKDNFGVDEELDGPAPMYSFGDYGKTTLSRERAADFSNGVDKAIDELVEVIRKNGRLDPAEGGVATITFGELFEKYEQISDMLVGLLMRAKKRKRVKYHGDMLFQGIHDNVKITLLY